VRVFFVASSVSANGHVTSVLDLRVPASALTKAIQQKPSKKKNQQKKQNTTQRYKRVHTHDTVSVVFVVATTQPG
jgi:hypothetical protein